MSSPIEFEALPDVSDDDIRSERAEERERGLKEDRMARLRALREERKATESSNQAAPEGEPPLPNRPPGSPTPRLDGESSPPNQGIGQQIESADPLSVIGLAKSAGQSLINAPGNVIGGAIGGVAEAFETVGDLLDDGNRKLIEMGVPGIAFDEGGGISPITDPDELEALPNTASGIRNKGEQLPVIGEEDSVIRGISKFFTGFAAGGKALQGTQLATRLAKGGVAGQSALASLKGVVADFAFMDEMDNPVNALVEAIPSLEGPVSEFFDADEESTDTENRLKNALLGAGVGTAVDGVFTALKATRGLIRSREAVSSLDEQVDAATNAIKTQNSVQREEFNRLLGDVDAPMIETRAPVRVVGDAGPDVVEDPGEVFINWARIDTDDDVKEMIQQLADNDSASISMSQRGVRSHIDTEQAATQLNAWDTLVSRRHGEALNAEQSVASRKLWASSGRKVLELSEAASVPGASPATQVAFRKQLALHSTIQRQVMGARTETARALNSWRIPAGDDFQFFDQMDALTAEMERGVPTQRLAENIRTLHADGNMAAADTFMYGAGRVSQLFQAGEKASAMMRQWWYFSLLSRATTHIRNFVGNSSRLSMEVMDRRVAAGIGEVLGNQTVPSGEATALIYGQTQGAIEAFRIGSESRRSLLTASKLMVEGQGRAAVDAVKSEADGFGTFWKSVATGDSGFGIGKVDARASGAFSSETLGFDQASNWGRVFDTIDIATSVPGRALAAGDEIFKTMSFNGERHAQAFRKATTELDAGKITREAFDGRVAEIANDPDEAIRLLMRDAAQRNTFTNDPVANGGSHKIWNFVKSTQQIPILGRLAMPFGRTPYNIANESLRRSPLGALMPGFWNDLAAGGAKADIAWSKLLTGNAIILGMADLALSNKITGERPRVNRESGRRQLEHRLDIKAMTFRIDQGNGKTLQIPYRGFEPLTYPMGLAANLVEIMDSDDFQDPNVDTQDLALAAAGSLAMQMSSANYMRGVSELFAYVADPGRYGEQYIEGIVRSMVPGAVSQFVSGEDPYIREIDGWSDAFTAQLPVRSKTLTVRRDFWGKPLERKANGVLGSIMPFVTDEADLETVDKEMARIQFYPAMPKRKAGFPIENPGAGGEVSVSVDMEKYPGSFSRFLELSGNALKDPLDVDPPQGSPLINPPEGYFPEGRGLLGELNAIIAGDHGNSIDYEDRTDGPDGGKAGYIQAVTNYYRRVARIQLMEEFPEIAAEVESRRNEAARKFIYEQEQLQ